MSDEYLQSILKREAVDTSPFSPAYNALQLLQPAVNAWGNGYLASVTPSGSFAKGTANKSGTDLDLFLSIRPNVPDTLKSAYESLRNQMANRQLNPRRQNVSIRVSIAGLNVDLVPARQQGDFSGDHSIYHRKSDSWRKTNVQKHIELVRQCGRTNEIRLLKLWRDQCGLDFPSFYLELVVIEALRAVWYGTVSENVVTVLRYLSTKFRSYRCTDPANSNNVISEDLTLQEKIRIESFAQLVLSKKWYDFVR